GGWSGKAMPMFLRMLQADQDLRLYSLRSGQVVQSMGSRLRWWSVNCATAPHGTFCSTLSKAHLTSEHRPILSFSNQKGTGTILQIALRPWIGVHLKDASFMSRLRPRIWQALWLGTVAKLS